MFASQFACRAPREQPTSTERACKAFACGLQGIALSIRSPACKALACRNTSVCRHVGGCALRARSHRVRGAPVSEHAGARGTRKCRTTIPNGNCDHIEWHQLCNNRMRDRRAHNHVSVIMTYTPLVCTSAVLLESAPPTHSIWPVRVPQGFGLSPRPCRQS